MKNFCRNSTLIFSNHPGFTIYTEVVQIGEISHEEIEDDDLFKAEVRRMFTLASVLVK